MTKKWEKRYWIYAVISLYWLVGSITKIKQFDGPALIGAVIDWLLASAIIILIIEAIYRKMTQKKKIIETKDEKK